MSYKQIKSAILKRKTESSQVRTAAKALAQLGHRAGPTIHEASGPGGSSGRGAIRIYTWSDTPVGTFSLLTGPSFKAEVKTQAELNRMPLAEGFSIRAVSAGRAVKARTKKITDSATKVRAKKAKAPRKAR